MANPIPQGTNPVTAQLLRGVRRLSQAPLVGSERLLTAVYVLRNLPPLEYPLNSAGELVGKSLGGARLQLGGREIDLVEAVKRVPAYYFPIVSAENFLEKIAELLKHSRVRLEAPTGLSEVKKQLPPLRYPIATRKELRGQLAVKSGYQFRGRPVDLSSAIKRIPKTFFPITSEKDFDNKMAVLIVAG